MTDDGVPVSALEPATSDRTDSGPMVSSSARNVAVAAVGLAVVAVTLLAVVVVRLGSQSASIHRRTDAAAATYISGPNAKAALAAAKREVIATLTYNYKTLQADFATAEKGLSPSFLTTYKQTTADQVTPLATKYKAISSATLAMDDEGRIQGGVSASTATTATVLLFVDQTVKNTQLSANERLDRSRIVVGMVNIDGHWLVNSLKPL